MKQQILIAWFGLLLLPGLLWAGNAADDFLRLRYDERGRPQSLQVAIKSYVAESGSHENLRIDLISAVHIGDAAYYAELNRSFREYDVVLYELIAPPRSPGSPVRSVEEPQGGLISSTQMAMTAALELSFQLDEIDYAARNLVHADLSPDGIEQSMEDRDESLYTYFWKLFYVTMEEVAKDPLGLRDIELLTTLLDSDRHNALKVAFATQLVEAKSLTAVFEGEEGSTLIAARNIHALEVLRRQIDAGHRHVGIFYGAAHMEDMERRLLSDFAVHKQHTIWIDAWWLQSAPGR